MLKLLHARRSCRGALGCLPVPLAQRCSGSVHQIQRLVPVRPLASRMPRVKLPAPRLSRPQEQATTFESNLPIGHCFINKGQRQDPKCEKELVEICRTKAAWLHESPAIATTHRIFQLCCGSTPVPTTSFTTRWPRWEQSGLACALPPKSVVEFLPPAEDQT